MRIGWSWGDGIRVWRRTREVLAASVGLALLAIAPAAGGSIAVEWDPLDDPSVQSYRVYYGTTPGVYSSSKSISATATSTVLDSLADCAMHYVVVRAFDGAAESVENSNEVRGLPRPLVTAVSPTAISQGETKTFTVSGANFDGGVAGDASRPPARVVPSNPGLLVRSAVVDRCGQITVTIEARPDAALGFAALSVENPDLSYGDPDNHRWVVGSLAQAIEVRAAADVTPPQILSVTPTTGATRVAATVHPTLVFSEAISAASVSVATVQLLGPSGHAMPQAAGSPLLAGGQITIEPAIALSAGQTYQVFVRGGASGVKDLAGNPLGGDWRQSPGFTIAQNGPGPSPPPEQGALAVESSNPAAGATDVPIGQRTVTITFNQDISVLGTSLLRRELQTLFRVTLNGRLQPQASTSPSFADDGRTVVITLLNGVAAGGSYRTEAGPANGRVVAALEQVGIAIGVLAQRWTTNPPWTVANSVAGAAYQRSEDGAIQPLALASAADRLPRQNTNVPVDAQLRVTFIAPVAAATLTPGAVRIVSARGVEARQAAPPSVAADDPATLVLTPAEPLAAGARYAIVLRAGEAGVRLRLPAGEEPALAGGQDLAIPFVTAISAAAQSSTLGVAR